MIVHTYSRTLPPQDRIPRVPSDASVRGCRPHAQDMLSVQWLLQEPLPPLLQTRLYDRVSLCLMHPTLLAYMIGVTRAPPALLPHEPYGDVFVWWQPLEWCVHWLSAHKESPYPPYHTSNPWADQ